MSAPKSGMNTPYGSRSRPQQSNFELMSWLFMRISGVLLWVLVLGHLFIMHVLNSVADINFEFVEHRWSNPLWRLWDWTMLILALIHGLNGVRVMCDDYLRRRQHRVLAQILIYVAGFVFILIGSLTLLLFRSPTV